MTLLSVPMPRRLIALVCVEGSPGLNCVWSVRARGCFVMCYEGHREVIAQRARNASARACVGRTLIFLAARTPMGAVTIAKAAVCVVPSAVVTCRGRQHV